MFFFFPKKYSTAIRSFKSRKVFLIALYLIDPNFWTRISCIFVKSFLESSNSTSEKKCHKARFGEKKHSNLQGITEQRGKDEGKRVKTQERPANARKMIKNFVVKVQNRQFVALSNWVGQEVELSNSRKYRQSRERNKRDTSNVPPFAAALVENDQSAASWHQRLQNVEKLLENQSDCDALAFTTIYLFWISVGAISCVEDGAHYRLNHHAGSTERMFGKIEQREKESANEIETLAVIRRLHPRLPALTADFTKSVPLTRIRDITHGKGDKNGKCREVRQEIKHTIQNKLHRCSGPEDLVASEKMLQKLTAPGTDYLEEFVNEFKIFYRELKEFFNASGVVERLEKLINTSEGDSTARDAANAFLRAKIATDDQNASLKTLLETLRLLHESRNAIIESLESGNMEDMSERQQWRLAEISLEDYAFVLLSRCSNLLGTEEEPLKQSYSNTEVRDLLNSLAVSFDALNLSYNSEEMKRVAKDSRKLASESSSKLGSNDGGLHVNAIAERAKRAVENFVKSWRMFLRIARINSDQLLGLTTMRLIFLPRARYGRRLCFNRQN